MARIRTIKPEILDDSKAARLSDAAWRLWVSMWVLADDHGRLAACPELLTARVFWAPREDSRGLAQSSGRLARSREDVRAILDELSGAGFVRMYEVHGEQYAEIANWFKHQKIDHPSGAKCPEPPPKTSPKPLARGKAREASRVTRPSSRGLAQSSETLAPRARAQDPDPDPDHFCQSSGSAPSAVADPTIECSESSPDLEPIDAHRSDPWGLTPDGQDPDGPVQHEPEKPSSILSATTPAARSRKRVLAGTRTTRGGNTDAVRNAEEVFSYWASELWPKVHPDRPPKASDKRLAKIRARLEDGYSIADLKAVVDRVACSPYHLGDNESRTPYIEPETIMRNAEKVDQWLAKACTAQRSAPTQQAMRMNDDPLGLGGRTIE